MCRSFEETGYCRYGTKCQFAHDVSELREVNRHPRYKTEVCKTFWEQGHCPYGKRCCFIHSINTTLQPNLGHSGGEADKSPLTSNLQLSPTALINQKTDVYLQFPITPNSSMYDESWNELIDDQMIPSPSGLAQIPNPLKGIQTDNEPAILTPFESSYSFDFSSSEEFIELLERQLSLLDSTHLGTLLADDGCLDEVQCKLASMPIFSACVDNFESKVGHPPMSCIGQEKRHSSTFNPLCNHVIYNDGSMISTMILPRIMESGPEPSREGVFVLENGPDEKGLLPDYLIQDCLS